MVRILSEAFVNEQIADGVQRQETELFADFAERYVAMNAELVEQQKAIQRLQMVSTKNAMTTATIRYKEV